MRFGFLWAKSVVVVVVVVCGVAGLSGSAWGLGLPAWTVRGVAEPTQFAAGDAADQYSLVVLNSGGEPSSPGVTLTDRLPKGLTFTGYESGGPSSLEPGVEWVCSAKKEAEQWVVTCTFEESIPAGAYAHYLLIKVAAPSKGMSGVLRNEVLVSGGGASVTAGTSESAAVNTQPPAFAPLEFNVEANSADGEAVSQAGGHPWEMTTSFGIPLVNGVGEDVYTPVEELKKVSVELPLGFAGDPLATAERCRETQLTAGECPASSEVGSITLVGSSSNLGEWALPPTGFVRPVYNMVAEGGYPAALGFVAGNTKGVYLYASVVHSASGDRLRIATLGIPTTLRTSDVALTVWGEPGQLNGSGSEEAFLSDPADCAEGPSTARLELESWDDPGRVVTQETTVFPELSGCGLLGPVFAPSFGWAPSSEALAGSSRADEPSGYTADLRVAQGSGFAELATPALRDAAVTLPAGVSISPAAGQGLAGCEASGPEGINLGSSEIGVGGEDLGDPEATELGAGHAGGNGSPYDDGQYHVAPGHCPMASTVGTVEVFTPVLPDRCGGEGQAACGAGESPAPLQGHVFLAAPRCGGAGQPACSGSERDERRTVRGVYRSDG